ncbi:hypothetical protein F4824DRAFT_470595, partial [Ustulina deusta]
MSLSLLTFVHFSIEWMHATYSVVQLPIIQDSEFNHQPGRNKVHSDSTMCSGHCLFVVHERIHESHEILVSSRWIKCFQGNTSSDPEP